MLRRLLSPSMWKTVVFRRRRITAWVLVASFVGTLISLQVLIISVLSVVALRRKQRTTGARFPHPDLGSVTVGENALEVYSFGRDLYEAMLEAIDSAKETIYFETFIWKGDAVGRRFKEHIVRKAEEGVAVYIIYDRFGNLVVPRAFKRFPPTVHALMYQSIRRPWHLLDPRRYSVDHRKLLIVDGKISFIGGYNIGSLYATQWRDTHLRICGPEARELGQAFIEFWNRFAPRRDRIQNRYARRFEPTIAVHTNDSLRLTFPIRDLYIGAVDRAQHHILLTNAYFVPDRVLLDALKDAARRGVNVEVLLPWRSNHIVADWIARAYFAEALDAGIHIWAYQDVMIHAKTCTVDGQWSTIGTANIDRLSAVGNYEINVEVYSDALASEMEYLFARDKTNAEEITHTWWLSRPWYIKLSERILAPLSFAV